MTASHAYRRHVAEHEAVDRVLEVALHKIGVVLQRKASIVRFQRVYATQTSEQRVFGSYQKVLHVFNCISRSLILQLDCNTLTQFKG